MGYNGTGGMSGLAGFGEFVNDISRGCGTTPDDVKVAQGALNVLGYKDYENKQLVTDGKFGPRSNSAWTKYYLAKVAQGKPNANCSDLIADALSATKNKASGAGDCPTGMIRWMGVCVPDVLKQQQPQQPGAQPAACKEGEIGLPGFCVPNPLGQQQPSQACPAGYVFAGGACIPAGGGVVDPSKPQPAPRSAGMSPATKAALAVGGGVAIVGLAAAAFFLSKRRPMRAIPNFARGPQKASAKKAPKKSGAKRARGPGKVITIGKGKKARRWGHTIAPKKHREKGATRQSQYAWSEGFKYPIYDARHARAAQAYFARFKFDLPMNVRREIAKNINAAKKRFGIGGKPVVPNRRRG